MKSRGMPVLYLFFFPPAVECNYMHQLRGLHRPRTSSPMMPSALCLALFISMVARVHSQCAVGTYSSSITTFSFPSGVQINYPISAISNLGCTLCYNQPYSHVTMNSNILPCTTNAGSQGWILMGSKEYEASSSFSLIAAIKATDLVPSTSSSSTAYGPHNGAYWYFYSGYSIGFAAASNINLFKADYADPDYSDCATRLSWHLNDQGGWRSGCTTMLFRNFNDYFRKVVYVCQGVAGVSCTNCPAGKSSPSGSTSSTACINCLAGKYSTAGSLCTNCEAGKYTKMPTLRCGGRNCGTGCTPSDGMFSGTISDGPGDYGDNADCRPPTVRFEFRFRRSIQRGTTTL